MYLNFPLVAFSSQIYFLVKFQYLWKFTKSSSTQIILLGILMHLMYWFKLIFASKNLFKTTLDYLQYNMSNAALELNTMDLSVTPTVQWIFHSSKCTWTMYQGGFPLSTSSVIRKTHHITHRLIIIISHAIRLDPLNLNFVGNAGHRKLSLL